MWNDWIWLWHCGGLGYDPPTLYPLTLTFSSVAYSISYAIAFSCDGQRLAFIYMHRD